MNEYTKQAKDFLETTKTSFKAEFNRHGLHFPDDKDTRDIYKITLSRSGRTFTFGFGQSIVHSGKWRAAYDLCGYTRGQCLTEAEFKKARGRLLGNGKWWIKNSQFQAPTAYDVLASLTNNNPGTFEDFCNEYGYSTDSILAKKTYEAVVHEYTQLCTLFSDKEMALMAEIQ